MDNSQKINLLLAKIENLSLRQQSFESEIAALRQEVNALQSPAIVTEEQPIQSKPFFPPPKNTPPVAITQQNATPKPIIVPTNQQPSFSDRFSSKNIAKSDFEKFIGENLISKIGILILIIGVGIGAKYAIDNQLISPLTRIILGYLVGAGLLAFAIKLKAKYEKFSAVLVSGAITIMYFITYAAYDFYALIPQPLAFLLMVAFTSFTIVAAIKYNQQVIAHIGLVGAYAVPFLLSDGSEKVGVLFTYMAIINIGILAISFKKHWKPLFHPSFALTWIIFLSWLLGSYSDRNHFTLSLAFSTIFFFIFYVTNLAYKVSKKEVFGISDITLILLNSFIYYGIGYYILSENKNGIELLGLFTLANAIIHFVVGLIIYKKQLADKNLFYLVLALVITFITMAAPVQLNGGWVTVFWTVEAAVLFYLARVKQIAIYEKLSFPLIFIAFFSLLQDWTTIYGIYLGSSAITPFLNVGFLTGIIFIAGFAWMTNINAKHTTAVTDWPWMRQILNYALPAMLIIVVYTCFERELTTYFNYLFESTKISINPSKKPINTQYIYDSNYYTLKNVWVFIYTMFFAAALTYLNVKKIRNSSFAVANLIINLLMVLSFLVSGLYLLSELRETYLNPEKYFVIGSSNIVLRYVALVFFAILIASIYQLQRSALLKTNLKTILDYVLYISILWIISSELINILELMRADGSYKLGLSILWGAYSLFLIGLGLAKNKKHLRIGAMALFGITLIKLFFYDIAYLSTISKTVVFLSLGILLLIISFLYNKYKHLIIDETEVKN
ncbi:DUF2339 domain-containing protein [Pedobacter sp. SL55]|uniref:DUF2339 domain-containing protein n=1 Tax=Pedobacter sp. SL55 TaxID=2995161 RepID=UPI00226E3002|nr:DUF2339 domain-containing protein [Pedobacter sp. SL55]WAC40357.1 DUF2339 domain-containing protein [Pedobacter sp. SL55]